MHPSDVFGWVGRTLDGKVAVEAVAGEGAFALVYRGRHLGLDEPVAVKCLKIPSHLTEADRGALIASFRAEARALHRLSRRTATIVQALDLGAAVAPNAAWSPYIVMEWLEGETLRDELARRAREALPLRSIDEAIRLLTPAARALAIAHEEDVVHRDVKPSNLFLARTRHDRMLKVVDFGIARLLHETQSRSGSAGGPDALHAFTPQYAAPEQFSAQYGQSGPWTDVFALALVLIEIASGRPALEGDDLLKLYVASVDERIRPSLARRGVAIPGAVEEVLERALEVYPTRRYESAGAFWAALEAANAKHEVQVAMFDATALDPTTIGAGNTTSPVEGMAAQPIARATATVRQRGSADAAAATTANSEGAGAAPVHAPTLSSGENRVCTVLFATLEQRPGAAPLDPEAMTELLDDAFTAVRARLEAAGGLVERVAGDCVTAVFGVPRATDNDAERAVHAALALQAAIGEAAAGTGTEGRPRGDALVARIGISTGRVFARAGSGTPSRLTIVGDAVTGAARLHEQAAPGETLIAGGTYRQVAGSFDVEALSAALGSAPETASLFRVIGPSAPRPLVAPPDFFGVTTEFVGRSAELLRLRDLLETVGSESRARLCTVVGPPGIGRTRLLVELAAATRRDVTTLVAQCSPLATESSYALVAALVRSGFGIAQDDTVDEIARKLAGGVRGLSGGRAAWAGTELDALAAAVAVLFGHSPDALPSSRFPSSEGGAAVKARISAAVARLLEPAAACGPLLVLCDDIQWADEASLDLIDDLVVRMSDLPLCVVCAARPVLYERRPHWGEGKPAHTRMELDGLARRHIEQMARDRLRNARAPSPALFRVLCDRAEGSPLILEETLRLLVDVGVVEIDPGGWRVHEDRLGALQLPPTIQGIVQARLDRLAVDARLTLAHAAVVGRTFWYGALEALAEADPPPDARPLALIVAELRDKQIIRIREPDAVRGEQELVFADAATHEVAYGSLSTRVRSSLHRVVADWLERRSAIDSLAAVIAHHHEQAGNVRAAAVLYGRAGAHAAAVGQHEQALRYLDHAQTIHDGATAPAVRPPRTARGGPADARIASWRDRARVKLERGDVLRTMGRLVDAEDAYEQARARVLRREARANESWHESESEVWEARLDYRLALLRKLRADYVEAKRLVERAIGRSRAIAPTEESPAMYALLASVHRREGNRDGWRRACLDGLRAARSVLHRDARFREAVSTLLVTMGGLYYVEGKLVRAERLYRQAARVVDERTQPHPMSVAISDAGAVRFAAGDVAGARELFLRSLRLKERAGDRYAIAIAENNVAEVELELGSVASALEHARRAVRLGEQVDARSDLPDMYKNLARALLASGQLDDAADAGARAIDLAAVGGGRVYLRDVALSIASSCAALAAGTGGQARCERVARALEAALDDPDARGQLGDRAAQCVALVAAARGQR